MKTFAAILILLLLAVTAAPTFGGVIAYTNEATFKAALAPGYYQEDFDYAPWTTCVNPAVPSPQSFGPSGGWAYQVSAPSGLSGQVLPGGGGAVGDYQLGEGITATFTGTLPTAVGGIFWTTDLNGNPVNGGTVYIALANLETYTYTDTSDWDAFTGFISDSPIASIRVTTGGNWATMDHVIVGTTPEPATLAFLGLGGAAIFVRRRRGRKA